MSEASGVEQGQQQSQSQSVEISVRSAGDVELERRIFAEVSSVGRQLGTVLDVLAAVVDALADRPGFAPDAPSDAVRALRELRASIAAEKAALAEQRLVPPELLIEALDALATTNPVAYASYREQLAAWANTPR